LFLTPITLKAPKRQEKPLEINHLGDHLRYARFRRRLTPIEAGGEIGTNGPSIMRWERGRPAVPARFVPAVLRFLGYDPYPPPRTTLPQQLAALRRAWGWTFLAASKEFGVTEKTWWGWEVGRFKPLPIVRKFLDAFVEARHTEAVSGWPDTPPSGPVLAPACFKVRRGEVICTDQIRIASQIRWEREKQKGKG
jgi:DNA-binding XRE family transcriptional regulator